jgi:DMSO/TMAO reductase YedYZ molybdopterin-dependent catalytic subunit
VTSDTPDPGSQADRSPEPAVEPALEQDGERRVRYTRRWFIGLTAGLVAGGAGVWGLLSSRSRSSGRVSGPSGLVDSFPINTVDTIPNVPAESWVLSVDGLVERPLRFDRAAWLALPRHQEKVDFTCVEGWTVDNVVWAGVTPAVLLERAKLKPEGRFLTFHAYDGTYTDSLDLAEALDSETILADTIDGAPLPAEHGGPLRLVVPRQMGYKSVKWVVRIEVTAQQERGYWERRGYAVQAPVS